MSGKFEGYMFQYSNDTLILVSGVFDGLNDFYEIPYFYDINTHSIKDILFDNTKCLYKFLYYDRMTQMAVIQLNNKLYKAMIEKDKNYSLKIGEVLLDLNNIKKHNILYDVFKINDKYIIKKQSDFKCNYFIFIQ